MNATPTLVTALLLAPVAVAGQDDQWQTDFAKHTVPLEEIVPGGPPKDGIPAIHDPQLVSVEEADGWLDDREPEANGAGPAAPRGRCGAVGAVTQAAVVDAGWDGRTAVPAWRPGSTVGADAAT